MTSLIKVFYILFITFIGLLMLYQQSITTYFQQTYHRSIHFSKWQESSFFSSIVMLNKYLLDKEDSCFFIVKRWNNEILKKYNYHFIDKKTVLFDNKTSESSFQVNDEMNISKLLEQKSKYSTEFFNNNEPYSEASNITKENNGQDNIKQDISKNEDNLIEQTKPMITQVKDKVLFIGDSLMQGVAPRVKRTLYQKYRIESLDLSKQSTGLSYPKAFDWPHTVEKTLTENSGFKVLVVFMGPNDPWDFPVKGQAKYLRFKSLQWESAYRDRISRILNAANALKINIIWLGAPCMRKPKLHDGMIYLNKLYSSEVEKINGRYIATNELLGCSDLKYSNTIKTVKGNTKVRIDDGIHFTVLGQKIIADKILDEITIKLTNEEVTLP